MKILVVDDDRRIVKTTCDILTIKGYEPIVAFSGEEAVERVRTDPPHCVLMDIKMPGITGVEAMRQMKAILPTLPVVLVSAYATDELVQDAQRLGAYAVLSKPIDFAMILSFLALLRKEESILVVDDDPEFCRVLRDLLTLRGYRVETENEPRKALAKLDKDYKLVVLLDLNLGAADGMEVLNRIRDRYPTKPVILIIGMQKEKGDFLAKALKIGAYACLYKPFETDALIDLIEDIRLEKLQHVLAPA